jgi:threonine aldolase
MTVIDLRSDTVTQPSEAMREAIARAEVGDDVFGDDPTVNRLQAVASERFGAEAALFFPSGTQANLAAILAHCGRGEECIVGQQAHTYRNEAGGMAVLGSVQPQAVANQADGSLDLDEVEAAIKPDDPHHAITRLLALENTIDGKVLSPEYMRAAVELARRHGLSIHLDGARIFNASVKLGVPVAELCGGFDTVSFCLSKGLGAPVGTVLVGRRDALDRARRLRKLLGGGMRQAGVLAAAGLYALEHNVERLAEDHENAAQLASGLEALGLEVEPVQTNMVFVRVPEDRLDALEQHLAANEIKARVAPRMRLVTHLNLDRGAVDRALSAFAAFFAREVVGAG